MKIDTLLKEKSRVQLHLGGKSQIPGFIVLSNHDIASVDIVHPIEKYPYPLPDDSVDLIAAPFVVEKINPANKGFIKWMDEMWRILKPQGEIMISTPYAGSRAYYQDPTACNPCIDTTFSYFDPIRADGTLYKIYKPKPYKIKNIAWIKNKNMEVLLEKRQHDKSYK